MTGRPGGVPDDLGHPVVLPARPRRVVSLVPSLTEALAVSVPGLLAGATAWCTHPADLDVVRVGGTKNPDLDAITALSPDLVVANEEENRRVDVEELRARGVPVWVTDIRDVPGALASIGRLLDVLGVPDPGWLAAARLAWADPSWVRPGEPVRAVVPIWRRPWMALGSATYAGDVLARLGVVNVLSHHPQRYPRVDLAELPPADVVVLPDEPYPFSAADGPEAFTGTPVALVDGRALTWYGPAMVDAPRRLIASVRRALDRS